MEQSANASRRHEPWNKGKLVGQKSPLKLKDIWAVRIRLQIASRIRDLALFDLAIDSKLRACDLVKLRVRDVAHGERISTRAMVMQQKTQRPVQFEITEQTREAVRGGSNKDVSSRKTFCSQAGFTTRRTYPRASTLGLLIIGWMRLV
jgi:integrase